MPEFDSGSLTTTNGAYIAKVLFFIGKVSAEGKIQNKFDMRPHCEAIDSYGRLCRERTNKSMTKSRQIQLIDNDNGTYVRPMTRNAAGMDKKKVQVKVSDIRRARGDREEIVDTMFKLFERQTHWTSRQLIQETDQPEQFLKEILRDICVYVTKGANQGTYVLKPEYQASGEEPSSSSSQEVDSPFIGES